MACYSPKITPKEPLDLAAFYNHQGSASLPKDRAAVFGRNASSYRQAIESFRKALIIIKNEMNLMEDLETEEASPKRRERGLSDSAFHLDYPFFLEAHDPEKSLFDGFYDQEDLFVFANTMTLSAQPRGRGVFNVFQKRKYLGDMASRVLFNLGLSHHLQAIADDQTEESRRVCWEQSLHMYKLACTVFMRENQGRVYVEDCHAFQFAAIMNNMGHVLAKMELWERSAQCFPYIQNVLPLVQNIAEESVVEGFIDNLVYCLILKGPLATAAAAAA